MPTFRSIGVNHIVRTRLVTESIATASKDDSTSFDENERFQLLETPQAILCRNPTALKLLNRPYDRDSISINNDNQTDDSFTVEARQLTPSESKDLRHDVAVALINQSTHGKRIQLIRESIESKRRLIEKNIDHVSLKEETCPLELPAFRVSGAISVIEMIKYKESYDENDSNDNEIIPVLTTGCQRLDDLVSLSPEHAVMSNKIEIDGTKQLQGIPFGFVTQFSGSTATGKTQIALKLACSHGLHKTWYLSSSHALHLLAARLSKLATDPKHLNGIVADSSSSLLGQSKSIVLERTFFATVTNEYDVLMRLSRLEAEICNPMKHRSFEPILLVLDSCSGCLSVGDKSDTILHEVSLTIRRLTRTYNLATVLINGSVGNQIPDDPFISYKNQEANIVEGNLQSKLLNENKQHHRTLKPALGKMWSKLAPDICVWTDSLPNGMVQATLERHPLKMTSTQGTYGRDIATFRIRSRGIYEST